MLHPTHPCLSAFSGPSIPQLIAASFPLSDLRCFGFLSSAAVLDSDYSAFRLSFPFFPFSPVGGSFGAVRSPCGSLALPLLAGLLPCRPYDFGTQLTALPFSARCLASQWLPQRLGPPLRVLAFSPSLTRSGSGYLASGFCLSASSRLPYLSATLDILPQLLANVNNFFKYFLSNFTIY